MKIYILIVLLCLALVSCGDILDSEGNIRRIPVAGEIPTGQYYPNKVGNYWTYQILNSDDEIVDTATVTVEENTESSSENYSYIRRFTYNKFEKRNFFVYISVEKDSVYKYSNPDKIRGQLIYKLPIEVGSSWYVGNEWDMDFSDSAKVQSKEDIYSGNYYFEDVYKISFVYHYETSNTTEIRYFVPYVGSVMIHYSWFSGNDERFVLIDYNVD